MPSQYHKPTVEDEDEEGSMPFPSEAQFNRALDQFLPQLDAILGFKQIIRDNVFTRITEILQTYGKGEWSLRPRTFAILRMLGCTELMDTFVRENRLDIFLPYNESNLPDAIKGEEYRTKFLTLQETVLPPYHVEDLESGGDHVHFSALADDYFPSRRTLDQGEFSTVDHVYSSLSLRQYARKRIRRGRSSKEDMRLLAQFENELQAVKKMSHRHIVKLKGSYTDPFWVGLIMTPVADGDLEEYLSLPDTTNIRKQCLRTFFGCLTMAMGYLHQHNMCHGDVKPRNVLVKDGQCLLTDFGTTRFWEDDGRSTTNSIAACTVRYCAPEVYDKKGRGRATDIWSLGCVFLEMATVLCGSSLEKMRDFYATEGTQGPYTWNNLDATSAWIHKLQSSTAAGDDTEPLEWISGMLEYSPSERLVISQVKGVIIDAHGEHAFMCRDCMDETHEPDIQTSPVDTPTISFPKIVQSLLKGDVSSSEKDGMVTASMLNIPERSAKKCIPKKIHFKRSATPSPVREHSSHEELPSTRTVDDALSVPSTITPPSSPKVSKAKIATNSPTTTPQSPSSSRVRFGLLPEELRPSAPVDPLEEDDDTSFPLPEPLNHPPLCSKDCFPLPKSTLSPSYILAGCNHFSLNEINFAKRYSTTNLFVYGGLMFPHILHSIADKSIKGVYSPVHQRRLYPTSMDWARADDSIKSACGNMTPARLKGFDRWRVSKLDWAVIQDNRLTGKILRAREAKNYYPIEPPPSGEVFGFLILGITEEALRYIDMLLATTEKKKKKDPSKSDSDDDEHSGSEGGSKAINPADRPLQRQVVKVDVELMNGEMASVDATTYVYAHGMKDLRGLWSPERFLQSRKAKQLLRNETMLRTEEQILASTMQISYALTGDYLCSTITTGNYDELQRLLGDRFDPNGACKVYGYPLQAASCLGNKDMVRLLLDYGADVNSVGGRYQTPLIAATMASRKSITEQLLKAKADVLADGGVYVNALYQAVGHSDWAIAEMLLERGAWLTDNYREIVDLAREKGDEEMLDLLEKYDWRRQCRRAITYAKQQRREIEQGGNEGGGQMVRSSKILMAVGKKYMVLQTEAGSWRGHKLVAIVKAALEAGANPSIVDMIRNAMEPVAALVHMLKDQDRQERDPEYRKEIEDRRGLDSDESDIEQSRKEPERRSSPSQSSRSRVSFQDDPSRSRANRGSER